MLFEEVFEDLVEIEMKSGERVRMIGMKYPYFSCWYRETYQAGNERRYKSISEAVCGIKRVVDIEVDSLKRAGIWEKLSKEERAAVEGGELVESGVVEKVEKVKGVKRVGEKIPNKLHCNKCNKDLATNSNQLKLQVERSGKSMEEFIGTYKCRSCKKLDNLK